MSATRVRLSEPTRSAALAITCGALILSVVVGILAALLTPLRSYYTEWRERREYFDGWLPAQGDIVGVRLRWRIPERPSQWVTVELPVESAAEILQCLTNRREPDGKLVEPNLAADSCLELERVDGGRPVDICLIRARRIRIGHKTFVLPAQDAARLKSIVDSFKET